MTPLERAARALVDNYPLDSGEEPLDWQDVLSVVRAVLTAIREPSEAMREAAWDSECIHPSAMPDGAWQAMINAALAEEA